MEFISLEKGHNWRVPGKRIYTGVDLRCFHESLAFLRLQRVILTIGQRISGLEIQSNLVLTKPVEAICLILGDLQQLHSETPPIVGPRRYGNLAARDWHAKIDSQMVEIITKRIGGVVGEGSDVTGFLAESTPYLKNAFGSATRLDYGTGHELSFVAWLGSLFMVHILPHDTSGEQLLSILSKYYELVQSLIASYTLEPAGSHGVWGLDDHFHLSYLFGACQMISYKDVFPPPEALNAEFMSASGGVTEEHPATVSHPNAFATPSTNTGQTCIDLAPLPSSTLSKDLISQLKQRNLYFGSLSFVMTVKKGPFHEHSPILYNIAAAKSWQKVARGLWRMFGDQVMGKWPVVQHFWFGGVLYPWVSAKNVLKTYTVNATGDIIYDYTTENHWSELNSTYGHTSQQTEENQPDSLLTLPKPVGLVHSSRDSHNFRHNYSSGMRPTRR